MAKLKIPLPVVADPTEASPEHPLCSKCGLHATCNLPFMKAFVPEGWTGLLLVVGEAPGRDEDQLGRPFVGKAGQALYSFFESVGIKREDIALTNANRCRPVQNAAPGMTKIRLCRPFVVHDIQRLKPKWVLCLGANAMKSVLDDGQVTFGDARQRVLERPDLPGVKITATYHPASTLYKDSKERKQQILEDLEWLIRFKGYADGPVNTWPDPGTPALAIDLEFDGAKYVTFGAAWGDKAISHENSINMWTPEDTYVAGHNVYDDLAIAVANGANIPRTWITGEKILDSMMLSRLHDENRNSYHLEDVAVDVLNIKPWKKPTEDIGVKCREWPQDLRMERCRLDAWASGKLVQHYLKLRPDSKLTRFAHMLAASLCRVEMAGNKINPEKFNQIRTLLCKELGTRALTLKTEAEKNGFPANTFEFTNDNHTRRLLFDIMKLEPQRLTEKSKEPAVDKPTLILLYQSLPADHPARSVVAARLQYEKLEKLVSTYVVGVDKRLTPHGFLFPSINALGARTGRRSQSDPNLQNWPKRMRQMIVSRWPGGQLVSGDFSQLEPRILAEHAGIEAWQEMFRHGKSLYIEAAKMLWKRDIVKDDKFYKLTKSTILGCVPGDHEVLTPRGWVRFDQYIEGTPVAEWSAETRCIQFAVPKAFLRKQHVGEMLKLEGRALSAVSTLDHRWPVLTCTDVVREYRSRDLPQTNSLPVVGVLPGKVETDEDTIIGLAAIQADGSILHNRATITVKKTHKLERLQRIGAKFLDCQEDKQRFEIVNTEVLSHLTPCVGHDDENKTFDLQWLLSLTPAWRDRFLEELLWWDGRKYKNGRGEYSTTNPHNATIVQTIAHVTGREALVRVISGRPGRIPIYKVSFNKRKSVSMEVLRRSVIAYTGDVYCVSTNTGYFLMKHNNRVCVTGNTNYGMEVDLFIEKLATEQGVHMSRSDGEYVLGLYHRTFPQLPRFFALQKERILSHGFVSTTSGQRRHLPCPEGERTKGFKHMWNQAVNFPIQCLRFGQLVLRDDLVWSVVEGLRPGDTVLAVDEIGPRRKWKRALVEQVQYDRAECFDVVLESGRVLTVTGDHQHLVADQNMRWVPTTRLMQGQPSNLAFYTAPTLHEDSADAGFVAGMFDADGSLSVGRKGPGLVLKLAQKPNVSLVRVCNTLIARGFKARLDWTESAGIYQLSLLGGSSEIVRFLSLFRPPRLLQKFDSYIPKMGELRSKHDRVVSVTSVGVQPIVKLATDAKTFVAEGYVTHNCDAALISGAALLDLESALLAEWGVRLVDHFSMLSHWWAAEKRGLTDYPEYGTMELWDKFRYPLIINEVHDELLADTPDAASAEKTKGIMKEVMQQCPTLRRLWPRTKDWALVVDPKCLTQWV